MPRPVEQIVHLTILKPQEAAPPTDDQNVAAQSFPEGNLDDRRLPPVACNVTVQATFFSPNCCWFVVYETPSSTPLPPSATSGEIKNISVCPPAVFGSLSLAVTCRYKPFVSRSVLLTGSNTLDSTTSSSLNGLEEGGHPGSVFASTLCERLVHKWNRKDSNVESSGRDCQVFVACGLQQLEWIRDYNVARAVLEACWALLHG